MTTTLKIPKAAVSMQEGILTEWLVPDGATVTEGQPIYTLELEKSTMDVEAPANGVLRHIGVAGTTYKVGEVIGEIGSGAAAATTTAATASILAPGPVYHSGYVVKDLQAAIRHWVELAGAGPFVLFENFRFVDPQYRGQASGPEVTLAFAYSGDTCIELIEQRDATPSIYTEPSGSLHHVGILVDDLDGAVARYKQAGFECAFRGGFPFGGGCAYLDTRPSLGFLVEFVQRSAVVEGMLRGIRDLHQRWDRRDYTAKLQ